MTAEHRYGRVGGMAAILGSVVLVISTYLHPMHAHPADAAAAFTEYASDPFWVVSHLGQFLGIALITLGLVTLSWRFRKDDYAGWVMSGAAGAVASLALAGALQAVDGIALKVMVDRWAGAEMGMRPLLFETVLAVRQIEIGLASILSLLLGATAVLYGLAFCLSRATSSWLGGLGLTGGLVTMAAGVIQACSGFSDAAMNVSMLGSLLLMSWAIGFGLFLLGNRLE